MQKLLATFSCLLLLLSGIAQFHVQIEITVPALSGNNNIYIAGNFNNWNPTDQNYRFKKTDTSYSLQLESITSGEYQFKFTAGGWDKVETDREGKDIANRTVTITSDTIIHYAIARWKQNNNGHSTRISTASKQVRVLTNHFSIPELNSTRRIWIYLPKGYSISKKSYPVLYLHDGQNLFEDSSSFAGEWGVDEALDSLKNACIVVGIDNAGPKRMNEYNPHNNLQFGKGEGRAYLKFIVRHLKPWIDKNYRTLSARSNTFIGGSSMGALISFYAALEYPDVFGRIAIFSPAFWVVPEWKQDIASKASNPLIKKERFYFYAGGKESDSMVSDMNEVAAAIQQIPVADVKLVINKDGKHNEASWQAALPAFFEWLLKGEGKKQ